VQVVISAKLLDISRPQFQLPPLGALVWWHAWRRLVAKVGTSNHDRTISLKADVRSCINKQTNMCREWRYSATHYNCGNKLSDELYASAALTLREDSLLSIKVNCSLMTLGTELIAVNPFGLVSTRYYSGVRSVGWIQFVIWGLNRGVPWRVFMVGEVKWGEVQWIEVKVLLKMVCYTCGLTTLKTRYCSFSPLCCFSYMHFVLICTVVVLYCFVMCMCACGCVCVCVCVYVGFVMCVFVRVL